MPRGNEKARRILQDGPHLQEVGEGWLSIGGNGAGLEIFRNDPVAKLNAPGPKDKVSAAHLSRLGDTDLVQWYGRKSDGCFWPIGRILQLTAAGKSLLAANIKEGANAQR